MRVAGTLAQRLVTTAGRQLAEVVRVILAYEYASGTSLIANTNRPITQRLSVFSVTDCHKETKAYCMLRVSTIH